MKNRWIGFGIAGIILMLGVGGYLLLVSGRQAGPDSPATAELRSAGSDDDGRRRTGHSRKKAAVPPATTAPGRSERKRLDSEPEPDAESEPMMTEAEKKEADEEKRVEEFDAAVDTWMEARGKSVSMAEVDKFRDKFRRVPKARKAECIQRALNLIPDDNVMLLAGILFDKEQDREILDLVYNDILNRDEDVKKPILREVFKDKDHPNWADTAWILDVTGQLPDAKE